MQKWLIACISIMLCVPFRMSAQDSYADKANRYVQQYGKLAVAEQKRSGVPAAITLGQGILETEAGCSILVTGANNHFGIKCKSGWTGETFAHTDDAPDECFRKYKCCEDSYKDHSDYLKGSPRYASLFRLSVTDYAGWAYGLKKCGYATNPRYAQQLIKIIEDFHLQAYTYAALDNSDMPSSDLAGDDKAEAHIQAPVNNVPNEATATTVTPLVSKKKQGKEVVTPYSSAPNKGVLLKVNGLRAFYALKGEMLLQYALKFNVRYEHLLEINDLKDAPLPANMFVYLEKKNYRGVRSTHTVKQGENLLMISQAEGIQLRRLMTLNKLTIYGEEPVPGAILHLQEPAEVKPAVAFVYPPKEPMPMPRNNAYAQNATASNAPVYIEKTSKTGNIKVDNDMPIATTAPAVADEIPATPEATIITTPNTDAYITKPKSEEQAAAPQAQPEVVAEEVKPVVTEEVAKAPVADVPVAATINATTPPASTEVTKPTELGETPLLKDDAQEPAKTQVAVKEAPATEIKEETPAAAPQTAATETTVLTEEKRPDVATAPVAKEEMPAPGEAPKAATEEPQAPIAATPVVKEETQVPAETQKIAKEEINTPTPEPVKAAQPVHIDALNNDVAQKSADATTVASISAPAAVVAEAPSAKQDAAPEEPQDEFSRLKAKLDKVVYTRNDKATTSTPTVATAPVAPTPEVKAVKETPAAETAKVSADDGAKFYTVKKGDTAFNIAKRNNITMRQLLNWNNLDFETVKVGQRLRVKE